MSEVEHDVHTVFDAEAPNFKEWSLFFHKFGFIRIDNSISGRQIESVRHDLYRENEKARAGSKKKPSGASSHAMHKCFFERSSATIDLVQNSVLFDFAQYLIADVPGGRGNTLAAHLIHNNAFSVPPGGRGQAPRFHMDDCLQQVIIPAGKTLPKWIKLPVLAATWMVWLSDVPTPAHGPTFVVPESHRWGAAPDGSAYDYEIPMCGKAGTAVLVNNQLWHRGSDNQSDVARDTLQLTFARRIIGHKFKTIMNYQMPSYVLAGRPQGLAERFGFLQGGAYS